MVDQMITDRLQNAVEKGNNILTRFVMHGAKGQRDRVQQTPLLEWQSQSLEALQALFPGRSYAKSFEAATMREGIVLSHPADVERGMGVLNAAAEDVAKGWATDVREIVHGEVFDDLLHMASQLLKDGYVDAAAVMAGGALEVHVKELSKKNGVPIAKVAAMNQALWKENGAYSQAEWRNVDAWYDLRNAAAHQDDDSPRTAPQVELMIAGVRDFIIRHPA